MRIALGVEYKGTGFCGWQSQSGVRTVQACVEQALGRVADHAVRLTTAGRTDSGVHATGQVAHFDTHSVRPEHAWMRGANAGLPADVRVQWARVVSADFHARFSPLERDYRYIMYCSNRRPAVLGELCNWVYYDLALAPMQRAARHLLGRQDFSALRAAGCQARLPYRTIKRLTLTRFGPWLWLDVTADAFLQHMVRNIVGSLICVGRAERPPHWVREVLASRDRRRAGPTAPPEGLYLSRVRYAPEFGLPAAAPPVRFW